jgi:hypothetical protein
MIMSMPELSNAGTASPEHAGTRPDSQLTKANALAAGFMFGAQKLMLEEMVFAGNEILDRAQTEMHLLSELISKMAGAHSVNDIRTMYEECSKHQLEFIRRDCDRVFRNGERLIEASSKLFKAHPLN